MHLTSVRIHIIIVHIISEGGKIIMTNVTISLDNTLLEKGRKYAQKQHTSLNRLIRNLLSQTVVEEKQDWLDDCFKLMDKAKGKSQGKKWKREELYDV